MVRTQQIQMKWTFNSMETENEQGKQNKRRERTLFIPCQYEKEGWNDEEPSGLNACNNNDHNLSDSSPKSSNHKLPRPKPKKGKKSMFEEDIIDGFAIMSFKTLEELEVRNFIFILYLRHLDDLPDVIIDTNLDTRCI